MEAQEIFMIKRFIRARTPKDLELAMLKNNASHGAFFTYDIIHDGKNWFAWYLVDSRDFFRPKDLKGGK